MRRLPEVDADRGHAESQTSRLFQLQVADFNWADAVLGVCRLRVLSEAQGGAEGQADMTKRVNQSSERKTMSIKALRVLRVLECDLESMRMAICKKE